MTTNYLLMLQAPVDEAGPLWLLLERFFESLPVRPWVVALALLALAAVVVLAFAIRRKSKSPPH
jgi:hypothetical protein